MDVTEVLIELGHPKYGLNLKKLDVSTVTDCKYLTEAEWQQAIPNENDRRIIRDQVQKLLLDQPLTPTSPHTGGSASGSLRKVFGSYESLNSGQLRAGRASFESIGSSHMERSLKLDSSWVSTAEFTTTIPARLERLPWCKWHTEVCVNMALSWAAIGAIRAMLTQMGPHIANLLYPISVWQEGLIGTSFVFSTAAGAMLFGTYADRNGRKMPLVVAPVVYTVFCIMLAFTWSFTSFIIAVMLMGIGIGGEYAVALCLLNELVPARVRGTANFALTGALWLGYSLGYLIFGIFTSSWISRRTGWRMSFGLVAICGIVVAARRLRVPESPRWLLMKNQQQQAEQCMLELEQEAIATSNDECVVDHDEIATTNVKVGYETGTRQIITRMLTAYKDIALVLLLLVAAQTLFFYSTVFPSAAIAFTYQGLPEYRTVLHEVVLGGVTAAVLFFLVINQTCDKISRRALGAASYMFSACVLLLMAVMTSADNIPFVVTELVWALIFIGNGLTMACAYLAISEVFPLEIRAGATALFYCIGGVLGGLLTPLIFFSMVEQGPRAKQGIIGAHFVVVGVLLMTSMAQMIWGAATENRALEEIGVEKQIFSPLISGGAQQVWCSSGGWTELTKQHPKAPSDDDRSED